MSLIVFWRHSKANGLKHVHAAPALLTRAIGGAVLAPRSTEPNTPVGRIWAICSKLEPQDPPHCARLHVLHHPIQIVIAHVGQRFA